MSAKSRKAIAICVNHNRLSLVFFVGSQPLYWEISYVAAFTTKRAVQKVKHWIDYYEVDEVITEDVRGGSRKGRHTQTMLATIKNELNELDVTHIEVPRYQPFQSKYEQMGYLCKKYPQLKVLALKKRKYWENEHPHVSYFEAAAMADRVFTHQPPENLPV